MRLIGYSLLPAAIIGTCVLQGVSAQEDNPAARIRACAQIGDPDKRLACFDKLAREPESRKPNRAVNAAEPDRPSPGETSPTPTPADAAEAGADAAADGGRADFGLDRPAAGSELREISVVVVRARRAPYGDWILETQDGQVWRQSESRRYNLPDLPFEAEIKKRRFGGFYMVARTFRSGMSVARER